MPLPSKPEDRINYLRSIRAPKSRDLSLTHLADHVEKTYLKPHRQLGQLATLWPQFIPQPLLDRTALISLNRGVLLVHVADSASLFELDRLLRQGLEPRLRQASKAPLRTIRLKVAPLA